MDCTYFGVRTSNREAEAKCRLCKQDTPEIFRKCTMETNILMSTSINIDAKGNTIIVLPGKVGDDKLLVEL